MSRTPIPDYLIHKHKTGDLRIFHIPQIPMKGFEVFVSSPEEAHKFLRILADYDLFQFANNIKPDYSNAQGLEVFNGEEWEDWYSTDGDELDEYMESTYGTHDK